MAQWVQNIVSSYCQNYSSFRIGLENHVNMYSIWFNPTCEKSMWKWKWVRMSLMSDFCPFFTELFNFMILNSGSCIWSWPFTILLLGWWWCDSCPMVVGPLRVGVVQSITFWTESLDTGEAVGRDTEYFTDIAVLWNRKKQYTVANTHIIF